MKILNPKFLFVPALCGAMGVLSGYANYLTYQQVSEEHAGRRFLLTLLVTAIISYAIEWIREVIREGKIESASHPIFRTMGTFVIVLTFELFVIGFHTSSEFSKQAFYSASRQLLGPEAVNSGANWTLVLAGGLWIVVGALLAVWLSQSVKDTSGTTWQRILRAGGVGIAGGVIFAPAVMALYILGGRCLAALLDVFHQYGGSYGGGSYQNPLPVFWHNIFLSQNTLTSGWLPSALLFCVTLPLGLLDMAAQKNVALFMLCYLALAAFVVGYPAARKSKALKNPVLQIVLGAIWVLCLFYTAGPFCDAAFRVVRQLAHLQQIETLGFILLSAVVLWGVPGLLLGSLTPLLRRVAADTRNWAFVGYGSAVLLIAATAWARAWWALIPALTALAVGYMFQRGSLLYEYWPFAALCVATGICGATSLAQRMTFASEVINLHAIDVLQPTLAEQPAVASRVKSYDQLSPEERAQAQQSTSSSFAVIRGADGRLELVPVRMLDAEAVKRAQQFWNENAAAIQQLTDSITKAPQPPEMPQAKDLPPTNPFIEAAIDAMNHPDTAPKPPPAQAPPPPSDDLAMNGAFAELKGQSPESFPSASRARKNLNKLIPPVVETPPPDAAASPAATASPASTQAAHPAQANSISVNQEANGSTKKKPGNPEDAAKALELSLSGSVGFWVTIGLLACWSLQENEGSEEPADAG